ncbi:hypothetical protein AB0G73_10790 [Streptomyces sp. NPDC020719]|uniref:hypothetical protein n=1 Tax=Streptomyces sp. NPDC020719 TaxID=3154896 RepID=UPI00340215D4
MNVNQYVWCGACGQSRMYADPDGEFACLRCGAHTDPNHDLVLDAGWTWGVDSDGRLYGEQEHRQLTFVVRWETDSEGVSYDCPSMICTVRVLAVLSNEAALDVASGLVAERVATAYPKGPVGAEPIKPSWVFEDDALCFIEAVFEGAPVLAGGWEQSETI